MTGDKWSWLRIFSRKTGNSVNRDVFVFSFFLVISFVLWFLNSLAKDMEAIIPYPVRYINLPKDRVLVEDLPSKLDFYLKGPGYSIIKLRMAGSRAPVVIDISSVNYRRVPGSQTLSYYLITSALVPRLTSQLRADCQIYSVKPDTLFFSFDRIIARDVPVVPDLEIGTERQYFIRGSVTVEPDSVTITGPRYIIDTINAVRTRPGRLTGLNETIKKNYRLQTSGDYTISEKRVSVTIPVEQFTEAELEVPVKILNIPDTLDIKIFPDAVTVKCHVALSDYKKIKDIPFEVIADLNKTDLSQVQKIPIEVRNLPSFVSSLRISPTAVDFIIEKRPK